ncbi:MULTISPECIES: energy-coupling factor ABC transporter substrate-binding protein [unclassified Aeromicrobium]|uniref:energy-coupling factor ABC transporter substrate-binding protein n=1 Tax=unclassified Aeromicrobium TaxID=2633570 RepID=UPI00288C4DF5|nr:MULTISPECIES: energy-coupling factor ABC transporter substrate-binding protein [unclassified Aeromicrobium]
MRRFHYINGAIAVAIVLLVVAALVLDARRTGPEERFVGSDSTATTLIQTDNPGYEQWFTPLFSPTSGEVESGLFALQAGLGGLALGYCLGALRRRRRESSPSGAKEA